jgi:16S rRNA (uracil1498-N3)-methyltransferase
MDRLSGRKILGDSLRRFWIEKTKKAGDNFVIDGELFKHIFLVCRQDLGDKFELLTDEELAYFVKVTSIDKKMAIVEIIDERTNPKVERPWLHLLLCMPKFNRFELILEKSVELGVKSVTPVFSDFSFVKTFDKVNETKQKRWQKIIQSATQQSGRGDLMKLNTVVDFDQILKGIDSQWNKPSDCVIFPYEGDKLISLKSSLMTINKATIKDIYYIVGSEGGFSHQEVEKLKAKNISPVSLGKQVLRVETACIALTSILKYEFSEFS